MPDSNPLVRLLDSGPPGESPTDTIAAISTPPGRGGIGIIRIAGPAALPIAARLVELNNPLQHARATLARVPDPVAAPAHGGSQRPTLDQAVVTAHMAPRSYTGDDLVEIAVHGSPVVLDTLLTAALTSGARLAEPGEFTQRAFLSGRLDLTQAEAVHDLISAHTLEQARAAAQQMGGALSRRLAPTKESLLQLIALLEAGMDFASGELDDVDLVAPEVVSHQLESMLSELTALARTYQAGSLLRTGASMALVGRPNAGKSSLFNSLLLRSRAIVTPLPGTTRDTVEEVWSLGGIPIRLIDTAGLRLLGEAPEDEAERQGIQRSREALADADVVLLVHDATLSFNEEEQLLLADLQERPHIVIRNKVDLLDPTAPALELESNTAVSISALTGTGVDALRTELLRTLRGTVGLGDAAALTNRRQHEAVLSAISALEQASSAHPQLPHELLLIDLHTALHQLDLLTGQTTADDILHRIFSTFCIGK